MLLVTQSSPGTLQVWNTPPHSLGRMSLYPGNGSLPHAPPPLNTNTDLTTLKYVEPANAFGGQEEPKLVTTTVKEYDIKQLNSAIRGVFTGIAMMGFMHIYMKYTNPLLLQSIMPIKSAIEQNIVQIHVFGKPAIGDLKRPFKAASMFGGAGMGGGDIKTDKKTISAAEVSGAGGVKEE